MYIQRIGKKMFQIKFKYLKQISSCGQPKYVQ